MELKQVYTSARAIETPHLNKSFRVTGLLIIALILIIVLPSLRLPVTDPDSIAIL
jgi:hypothetical protein